MWIHHNGRDGADLYDFNTRAQASYGGHLLPDTPFPIHIWEQGHEIVFHCFPLGGDIKLRGTFGDLPTMIAQVMLVAG